MKTIIMLKKHASMINGGLTQTTKMPCKSYSLPTASCVTGYHMAQIEGSICSSCYANKGNYKLYQNNVEPSQHARLVSLEDPLWVDAMIASIGTDPYFRWHDSGDLQSTDHLRNIIAVCIGTPNTKHWLPTREYGMIKEFISSGGTIPNNLIVRLSAMYPDKPVIIPSSLQGIKGISSSEVHQHNAPTAPPCMAPSRDGECRECRHCWTETPVSYCMH